MSRGRSNEWRKTYNRRNWYERYGREEDVNRERTLNYRLDMLMEKYENTAFNDEQEELKILQGILEIYETLDIEDFEYNKNDYEIKEKRYKYLREKNSQEKFISNSEWTEYQRDEQ